MQVPEALRSRVRLQAPLAASHAVHALSLPLPHGAHISSSGGIHLYYHQGPVPEFAPFNHHPRVPSPSPLVSHRLAHPRPPC